MVTRTYSFGPVAHPQREHVVEKVRSPQGIQETRGKGAGGCCLHGYPSSGYAGRAAAERILSPQAPTQSYEGNITKSLSL